MSEVKWDRSDGSKPPWEKNPSTDLSTYVDKAMYEAAPMEDEIKVYLLNATPDPLGSIAAACMMYEGIPVQSIGDISDRLRRKYWEQVHKTHLKAPLEFVDLHFFVEGVTRAFTHQLVRQRTAVYAQESLRFAVKDLIAARPGPSIRNNKEALKKWEQQMKETWERYNWLIANGTPAEDARGILPHDTLTRVHFKTNLRNLLEHAGNRLCTQAQFEWRIVFLGIVDAINKCGGGYVGNIYRTPMDIGSIEFEHGLAVHKEGENFGKPAGSTVTEVEVYDASWQWEHIAQSGVFKPICFQLGHCPFTADFDRGCTIRSRVEEGKFDEIQPNEYMADPRAAWVS